MIRSEKMSNIQNSRKTDERIQSEEAKIIVQRLGKKIKFHRLLKDENVLQLSLKLGMSNSHLSLIENGQIDSPTILTYLHICKSLQIKPSELFQILDDIPPFDQY